MLVIRWLADSFAAQAFTLQIRQNHGLQYFALLTPACRQAGSLSTNASAKFANALTAPSPPSFYLISPEAARLTGEVTLSESYIN